MAKIEKSKVLDINAKCKNDWMFDLEHFFIWSGEKQLIKNVQLNELDYLQATLYFHEVTVNFHQLGFKPCIHINKYHKEKPDSEIAVGAGLGIYHEFGNMYEKRKFADLINFTADYSDEEIKKLVDDNKEVMHNQNLLSLAAGRQNV